MYNTSLPVIFGIPHYAAVLNKMAQERYNVCIIFTFGGYIILVYYVTTFNVQTNVFSFENLSAAYFRDIEVNIRTNLIEVKPDTHEAVFEKLGTDETVTYKVGICIAEELFLFHLKDVDI